MTQAIQVIEMHDDDIARSEGEAVTELETKMACIEVFEMGGSSKDDDGTESAYFAVRAALAQTVKKSLQYVSTKGLMSEGEAQVQRSETSNVVKTI